MLVYIAFRFEWIYGVAAVIAVFHDTIITIGLFSLFHKQIDLTVIAALLTLVGYSMNDTIVTFDRIRENLKLGVRGTFTEIVNLEHQSDVEPDHLDFRFDLLDRHLSVHLGRSSPERFFFCPGNWYYDRNLFFDLCCVSHPDLLAQSGRGSGSAGTFVWK